MDAPAQGAALLTLSRIRWCSVASDRYLHQSSPGPNPKANHRRRAVPHALRQCDDFSVLAKVPIRRQRLRTRRERSHGQVRRDVVYLKEHS